jgi:SulP family sulfate permease
VDAERLRQRGIATEGRCRHVQVAYLTGPLFFAAAGAFNEAFAHLSETHALILSMRGVPLLDTSGLQVMAALHERLSHGHGRLMLAAAHDQVLHMLEARRTAGRHRPRERVLVAPTRRLWRLRSGPCRYC